MLPFFFWSVDWILYVYIYTHIIMWWLAIAKCYAPASRGFIIHQKSDALWQDLPSDRSSTVPEVKVMGKSGQTQIHQRSCVELCCMAWGDGMNLTPERFSWTARDGCFLCGGWLTRFTETSGKSLNEMEVWICFNRKMNYIYIHIE